MLESLNRIAVKTSLGSKSLSANPPIPLQKKKKEKNERS
jgi:hypothetical protein